MSPFSGDDAQVTPEALPLIDPEKGQQPDHVDGSSPSRGPSIIHLSVTSDDEGYQETSSACACWQRINMERIVRTIKYSCSLLLMGSCIIMTVGGIMADGTPVARETRPAVAFFGMWLLIAWLGILEGGQGSLVGLQPIDRDAYRRSHTHAHQCSGMVYGGDNLNRFIVGRQFLVVLVVFCLNLCCTVVEDAAVPGFNRELIEIFVASGLAVMIITVIVGQLAAEVNATNCMLDFINSPLMAATTWLCLAIEASGLLHATYLVQCFFGSPSSNQNARSRTRAESIAFWIRVAFSTALLCGAFAVTWSALLNGQTTFYEGLSRTASIAVFFGLTCFLGILEAMQIAVFAVVKLPESELANYPAARANAQLVFKGCNFKAFLIGRQICVTTCMFLLARITTTDVDPSEGETVMGISDGIQDFFNTGLPGALITTIVASLVWRIVAANFPIPFLNNPVVRFTVRVCLVLEASGVFSAAWLCADFVKLALRFRPDDEYLGKKGCSSSSMDETGHTYDRQSTCSTFDEESSLDTESEGAVDSDSEDAVAVTYGATTH